MVWILVFAALVAASVYGAHRVLGSVDWFGAFGRIHPLPRALVYATAVLAGSQATDAAMDIHGVTSHQLTLSSGDRAQAIVQVLSAHATDIAWQAGLLLAAAALVAATTGGAPRRAR
jgi:hypothetical protein